MNDEISHIVQWKELTARAANFGLELGFDSTVFYLYRTIGPRPSPLMAKKPLGQYLTLADLRAGISDYVAGERAAGRIKG